jgi:dTDP-D-glucose 4,6-dehydratase
VIDLAYAVQEEVDRQLSRKPSSVEFIKIADRPYNDLRYLIDITKAKEKLNWEPEIPFEEGTLYLIDKQQCYRIATSCGIIAERASRC